MDPTWFVVADQSQAHLYRVRGTRLEPVLEAVESLEHPEGRKRMRADSAASSGTYWLHPEKAAAEENRRFVRQVIDRLSKGQREREFTRLLIAAPASFVGDLREHYGTSLASVVHREIIGDFTHDPVRVLEQRMRQKDWLDPS